MKKHRHQSTVEADINQAHLMRFDPQIYQRARWYGRELLPAAVLIRLNRYRRLI
ncbi:MAG TPA: hypothetical protein VES20_05765 [Bryobacteraceae bacterium]|nr:hypothetical protein [Bryobacteraceae bacterium]